jgi:hypothetical protein
MSQENFLWGAPPIHGELLKLGFNVPQATVSCYMPRRDYPATQTWRIFLRNQPFGIGTIGLAKQVGDQTSSLLLEGITEITILSAFVSPLSRSSLELEFVTLRRH